MGRQSRRGERGLARREAPRGPAWRGRLGARVRARWLADDHRRPARRLDRCVDGRACRRPADALGGRWTRPFRIRAARARGSGELRRPPHPVPALRGGGPPRAVLGAWRAGVAVPAADGARDPVPLRAGHHRRGAQRARLDGLRTHLSPPRRRGAAPRLGRRPGCAGRSARCGGRDSRRCDGGLLRRLHDDGRDHRAPRPVELCGEHRRDRQLRHLPGAHRRLPARVAGGRVRLPRA